MSKTYTADELSELIADFYADKAGEVYAKVNTWLDRGDGIAVYRNEEIGHREAGDIRLVSWGSDAAHWHFPPNGDERLPDGVGGGINWRYRLAGTYRGAVLVPVVRTPPPADSYEATTEE